MSARRNFSLEEEYYCTHCGKKQLFAIPRSQGKRRPQSHLKNMYCFHEQEEHNMVLVNEYGTYNKNAFYMEFLYGNFDENGTRKMSFGDFKNWLQHEKVDIHQDFEALYLQQYGK